MGKIQKTYTIEEKLQAVKMYEDRGLGYKAVAKDLGISDSLVRRWVKHYRIEDLEGLKEKRGTDNMNNVTVGKGKLAGKGIYATKDFEKGELVVPYNFKELSQAEFDALPHSEREWTHSFWGKIYLFPEPARYVNHDDDPSTFPDLDRRGNYALRTIKKGEAITIDDTIELRHELDTFLKTYEKVANSRYLNKMAPFIANHATFWFTNGTYSGKSDIEKAFEDKWANIQNEVYTISDVQWIASNYWVAACTYKFKSDGKVDGKRQVCEGRGTNVLRRIEGSWRIVHEHLSKQQVNLEG